MNTFIDDKLTNAMKSKNVIAVSAFISVKAKLIVLEKSKKFKGEISEEDIFNAIREEIKKRDDENSFLENGYTDNISGKYVDNLEIMNILRNQLR